MYIARKESTHYVFLLQKELQLQDELHNLESELTVKTTKLKEDNKMLLKKLTESKTTNVVPATSRPDNVNSYFRHI